jgi:Cu/Ag efflux pump CusA
MHWVGKPGTSPEAMNRSIRAVSAELRAIPGVRNFGSHIGRAEVADEVVGPNFAELWISIDPNVDYDATTARIQTVVDGYPGLYRDVLTYLKERTKEVLSGASGGVVVRLYGTDLDVLRAKAAEIQGVLKEVPGVTNLKLEPQVLVPSIEVRVKPDAAARYGLTSGEVRRTMATLLKGQKVGEVFTEQRASDVVVWGEPRLRTDIAALREIRIATPLGGDIRLGDAVDIRMAPMPNIVQRENASRRIDVTCDVSGKDLGSVAREIEARVRKLEFPRGYHPEFLGEYAARQAARTRLLLLASVSLLGILMVIYTDFKSARLTALVAATLPFALVGGVFAVVMTGGIVSLGSLIGFVTVLGIAARNGILLVSHYRHLEIEEGQTFGLELILQGARERLSPILMTASVTGLALVPVVLGGVKPGQEIEYPMACVILGGLATSTALNLFVLPALYLNFGRHRPQPGSTVPNPAA